MDKLAFLTFLSGLWKGIADMFSKNGIKKTFLALFIMVVICLGVGITTNYVINRKEAKRAEEEMASNEKRRLNDSDVQLQLSRLLNEVNADRAVIYEFHNGVVNPHGLGFNYAELTYEEIANGADYLDNSLHKLTLSLYQWPEVLSNEYIVVSKVSECGYDNRLKRDMDYVDVGKFGSIIISGKSGEIGILSVHYSKDHMIQVPSEKHIQVSLTKYASSISHLLDKDD